MAKTKYISVNVLQLPVDDNFRGYVAYYRTVHKLKVVLVSSNTLHKQYVVKTLECIVEITFPNRIKCNGEKADCELYYQMATDESTKNVDDNRNWNNLTGMYTCSFLKTYNTLVIILLMTPINIVGTNSPTDYQVDI